MTARQFKLARGVSLIEVMTAMLILTIAVLGAMAYRYYSALDARKADIQITASRLGSLLCESWRGVKGAETYDPITYFGSDLAIDTVYEGPDIPADFGLLGIYKVAAGGIDYYAVLSWRSVSPGLRALNITVAWNPQGSGAGIFWLPDKSFRLTTYAPI